VPVGYVQVPLDGAGKKLRTYDQGTPGHDQYVIPTDERTVTFRGRVCTFKTNGRAAVSQKIGAIHNATGSTVKVRVHNIAVDLLSTTIKAATVVPPIIRLYKFTALPTNGTALTKRALDSTQTSNASVTVWGDASADNTLSGTTLTITPVDLLAQEFAPRMITAAGIEFFDRTFFLSDSDSFVVLNALEGVVVFLEDATTSTGIPAGDRYVCQFEWDEYTNA
jgi:hypothetical protein